MKAISHYMTPEERFTKTMKWVFKKNEHDILSERIKKGIALKKINKK